jgi:hypothetical protein
MLFLRLNPPSSRSTFLSVAAVLVTLLTAPTPVHSSEPLFTLLLWAALSRHIRHVRLLAEADFTKAKCGPSLRLLL